MTNPLEQAMASVVQASRGTRPTEREAARMTRVSLAMREVLDRIAAESLFDTEPAQLETVLQALTPRTDGGR